MKNAERKHISSGMLKNKNNILFLLLLLGYAFFMANYSHSVPFWDAWRNVDIWIRGAITKPFNLLNFDNGGHPAFAWMFILSILQYRDYGNMFFLHGTVLMFSLGMIISFRHILKEIFPSKESESDLLLVTAIFAFFPIITASALHINQDYGVLVFFLIFLSFFFSGKHFLAAVTAVSLVFSKEPGIVIYSVSLFVFFIHEVIRKKILTSVFTDWIKTRWIYSVPYVFFILRMWARSKMFPDEVFWLGFDPVKGKMFLDFPTFTKEVLQRVPFSYFSGIFILQFNWILTIGAIIGLVLFCFLVLGKKRIECLRIDLYIMMVCIFILSSFILTRFKTFTNVRYFLPLYPLLIFLFYAGVLLLFPKKKLIRKTILALIFFLFFFSQFRLLDPFSKVLYGTFNFGRHEILRMTSLTGECCGQGRDQLVYNLQFLEFSNLEDVVFEDIRPGPNVGIAYDKWEGPEMLGRLDSKTYKRTIREKDSYEPYVLNWVNIDMFSGPDVIYFIEFPNMENKTELSRYLNQYGITQTKNYERGGYEINVKKLEKIKSSV